MTSLHRHGDRDPPTSVFLARLAETESVTVGGSIVPETESLWAAVLYRKRSHCERQCCTGNRVTMGCNIVRETRSLWAAVLYRKPSHCGLQYCTGNRVIVDFSVVPETESLWTAVLYQKRSHCGRQYYTGNQKSAVGQNSFDDSQKSGSSRSKNDQTIDVCMKLYSSKHEKSTDPPPPPPPPPHPLTRSDPFDTKTKTTKTNVGGSHLLGLYVQNLALWICLRLVQPQQLFVGFFVKFVCSGHSA